MINTVYILFFLNLKWTWNALLVEKLHDKYLVFLSKLTFDIKIYIEYYRNKNFKLKLIEKKCDMEINQNVKDGDKFLEKWNSWLVDSIFSVAP